MSPASSKKLTYAEKVDLYDKLVRTNPDLERKGKTIPYTSLNGNMFSYLSKSGSVALRLPSGSREDFLMRYKTTLHEAFGVVQKEYVTVPDTLLQRTEELKKYLEISYAYAKTLKRKPTTKKG